MRLLFQFALSKLPMAARVLGYVHYVLLGVRPHGPHSGVMMFENLSRLIRQPSGKSQGGCASASGLSTTAAPPMPPGGVLATDVIRAPGAAEVPC